MDIHPSPWRLDGLAAFNTWHVVVCIRNVSSMWYDEFVAKVKVFFSGYDISMPAPISEAFSLSPGSTAPKCSPTVHKGVAPFAGSYVSPSQKFNVNTLLV